jgi:hypothetical protein
VFSKKPSKEGKAASWSFLKLANGGSSNAWIAGDVFGCFVHFFEQSKPCLWEFTDGQLNCPFCRSRPRCEWRGYVPLYSPSGKPCFTIITADHFPTIEPLPLFSAVTISRGGTKFDTATITPSKWANAYPVGRAGRARGADILPGLLLLWKVPELTTWVAEQARRRAADSPVDEVIEARDGPIPVAEVPAPPVKPGGMLEEFRKRAATPATEPMSLADVLPLTNGHLKKSRK